MFIENAQYKNGINPMSSPSQKNLLSRVYFFWINKYGNSDTKGTNTKNVFIIKDKPIQIPKIRI